MATPELSRELVHLSLILGVTDAGKALKLLEQTAAATT
jgi:hypothetical protein